jgi:hypothetical protein
VGTEEKRDEADKDSEGGGSAGSEEPEYVIDINSDLRNPSWTMRNMSRAIQRCIRLKQFDQALRMSSQLVAVMRKYPDKIRGERYVLCPPYVHPHDLRDQGHCH